VGRILDRFRGWLARLDFSAARLWSFFNRPHVLDATTATQAQQTTPEQKTAEARQVAKRAAKGGAVGTGAAPLGLILGALAAAFGGKTGERYPIREVYVDERRTVGR
jgi:hypothetical protein